MTDSYIDADETQIYGPYAVEKIREHMIGIVPACDGALRHVATELEHATEQMAASVAEARTTDADPREGTRKKQPALAAARALLGRFSVHLDAHEAGSVDRKVFFPADGTARGVGQSASRVLLAVTSIGQRLGTRGSKVRDAAHWRAEMSEAAAALAVAHADGAKTARAGINLEVDAARAGWLNTYQAAKSLVEGTLRLSGQVGSMSTMFYDLAVPAGSKVVAKPSADGPAPVPPAPPARPTGDEPTTSADGRLEARQA